MAGDKHTPAGEETPEFRAAVDAAVDAAVSAAMPRMLAQISALREIAGTKETGTKGVDSGDPGFVKALALEIAKISGQNTGRTYVDPVELEAREVAMRRLTALLAELRAQNVLPEYRLVGKVQLVGPNGAEVIEPLFRDRAKVQHSTEIGWGGIPNLAMQPTNEAATRVMAEFCAAIGHKGGVAPEDDLGPMALNANGFVMRGAAARAQLRNDPATRGEAPAGTAAANGDLAVIRRGGESKRRVQVLGTLMPAIEVS